MTDMKYSKQIARLFYVDVKYRYMQEYLYLIYFVTLISSSFK